MGTLGRLGVVTLAIVAVLLFLGGHELMPHVAESVNPGAAPHGAVGKTLADWLVLGVVALAMIVAFRRHPFLALILRSRASSHGGAG